MRQILVDHTRHHVAQKCGGRQSAASLDESLNFAPERSADIIAPNAALRGLAAFDERKAKVIELRYFGGRPVPEYPRRHPATSSSKKNGTPGLLDFGTPGTR